ncbi:MAG: Cna B-type domain-containing protein, partial [Parasporobacterium sp.]|nr:Cna B-type domain-containing protein [Parasporobacterium sp.]
DTNTTITIEEMGEYGSVDIPVTKVWKDNDNKARKRPVSIEVQLYADGKAVAGETVKLNKKNNWTYLFSELPEKKAENGKMVDIEYTVKEVNVPSGYKVAYSKDKVIDKGLTVTNTYEPDNGTDTGDSSGLPAGVALMAMSLIGGLSVLVRRRKTN